MSEALGSPESLWVEQLAALTGYSERVLFQKLERQDGDWERDLGIDRRKREKLLSLLPPSLQNEAAGRALAQETRMAPWKETLGFSIPRAWDSKLEAGSSGALSGSAGRTFDPSEVTEERLVTELLDVVVLKTGYERELLRLDAELEKDLGIDSVKQAQILGELRKRYPLEFRQGLRLKDFPTLRHWIELTQRSLQGLSLPGPEVGGTSPQLKALGLTRTRVGWQPSPNVFSSELAAQPALRELPQEWDFFAVGRGEGELRSSLEREWAALNPAASRTAGRSERGLFLWVGRVAPEELSAALWTALTRVLKDPARLIILCGEGTQSALTLAALGGALRSAALERMPDSPLLDWISVELPDPGEVPLAPSVRREWVFREASRAAPGTEVRLRASPGGGQSVLREVRCEMPTVSSSHASLNASSWTQPGRRTLIVGGAKGLGFRLALQALRLPDAEVWVLGRSGRGDPELERNLAELEAQALRFQSRVVWRAADVLDPASLAEALRGALPWDALVYAAGVIEDTLWSEKTEASFRRVMDSKVRGLAHLLQALAAEGVKAPREWALFSSFSARRGNPKQLDYAAANEALRVFGEAFAAEDPSRRVRVFDWGAFGEVGMAVRSGLAGFLESAGEPILSAQQGLLEVPRAFSREEQDGFQEILVLPQWEAFEVVSPERSRASRVLDPEQDLWLKEHTIFEDPLMPAVFGIEFLAASAAACATASSSDPSGDSSGASFVEMSQVEIESGVALLGGRPLAVRLEAEVLQPTETRRSWGSQLRLMTGESCYRAEVSLSRRNTKEVLGTQAALQRLLARRLPSRLAEARRTSGTEVYRRISLGPSFQILEEAFAFEDGVALGRAPAVTPARFFSEGMTIPELQTRPDLLEAVFHCAAWVGLSQGERVIVPRRLASLRFPTVAQGGQPFWFMAEQSAGGEDASLCFDLFVFEERPDLPEGFVCVLQGQGYETFDVTEISSWGRKS
jgi:NAD(P)-dependent dehydrogenase (short-subunit alcohol dehydrogenase family)